MGSSPKVTQEMNEKLIRDVSTEEIKETIFAIKPSSDPRADTMTGISSRNTWSVIGIQVTREVKRFFETGIMPREWN